MILLSKFCILIVALKTLLQDLSLEKLQDVLQKIGAPKFRAAQIFAWINKGVSLGDMGNIPKELKEKLAGSSGEFIDYVLRIVKVVKASDGTEKYLYKLHDGEFIEGVFLPNNYGNTLCVSTQVGCRMGCVFCNSGENALLRNLSAGEIAGQFIAATNRRKKIASGNAASNSNKNDKDKPITNIVFMGSGEPLDNYDNTIAAIKLLTDSGGINLSVRNISVSTCGLVPQILQLANEGLGITLSLSLHAINDTVRQNIMPIAKKYSIDETIKALKTYFEKTGRRVCIEYALVEGKNDSAQDAKKLAQLLRGFPTHVNLISLNSARGGALKGSGQKGTNAFKATLEEQNISTSTRRSQGSEILGACGQLRGKALKE